MCVCVCVCVCVFLLYKYILYVYIYVVCGMCFLLCTGYPQLLSGTYRKLGDVAAKHQKVYFPEEISTNPWTHTNQIKRYPLSFPFFPFRTLCPRELVQSKMLPSPFEPASPLFPAHTQINIAFKRRTERNFLDFMLPENLPVTTGSSVGSLTQDERNQAVQFRTAVAVINAGAAAAAAAGAPAAAEAGDGDGGGGGLGGAGAGAGAAAAAVLLRDYRIKKVTIRLNAVYLLVLRIKYKGLSPERPLSNVYTSYRSTFTPLTKVSLHQYPLSWESTAKPTAVFISFVK